jgi:hypothetical protein
MIYVIVYDRTARSILSLDEFLERDTATSDAARIELEQQHRGRNDIEVVTLTSDSRDILRRTHSRYFFTDEEIIAAVERQIA